MSKLKLLTTAEIIRTYGNPGDETQFVKIKLPYRMVVAWARQYTIGELTCHHLVADRLLTIFKRILKEYGPARVHSLGIDLYGGCYNFRQMRGGKDWSRHSWAVAIDLDPERNQLRETSRTARFARPEYGPMIDIFYEHDFINLGREKNYDWMHFQIGM